MYNMDSLDAKHCITAWSTKLLHADPLKDMKEIWLLQAPMVPLNMLGLSRVTLLGCGQAADGLICLEHCSHHLQGIHIVVCLIASEHAPVLQQYLKSNLQWQGHWLITY